MRIEIPASAALILNLLEGAGFEAYVVGGCVRDAIMGRIPNDWDITTSAKPEETKTVLARASIQTADTGIRHGTITAIIGSVPFEITTYRSEGTYSDGRHPDSVSFLDRIDGDLARRDFTINAMAYSPIRGFVDRFSGREDIEKKLIRAVGEPEKRFGEDALRILRCIRFASQLGFSIDPKTSRAVHESRDLLKQVSVERIWTEFSKLLCGKDAVEILREYRDVVAVFIPEIAEEFDFNQYNLYHRYDVWEHTLHALQAAPSDADAAFRFAVLLHDIAKPRCYTFDEEKGIGHMYGHEKVGAEIASEICIRLKLPNAQRHRIVSLVAHHMFTIPDTPKSMRRFLVKHGEEGARELFQMRICDRTGMGIPVDPINKLSIAFARAQELLEEELAEQTVFKLKDLAINGHELLELGCEQGPLIGKTLNELFAEVVDGDLPNDHEILRSKAEEMLKEA